jgi:hypothetical protein
MGRTPREDRASLGPALQGYELKGTELADEIYGLGGDDTLVGFAGDDLFEGRRRRRRDQLVAIS